MIATSLIANLWALSRMLHVIGQDPILPDRLAKLNKKHIPANAMLFVGAMSAEEIYSIMLKGKGTQFDSYLFEHFEKARPKIEEYYSNLSNEGKQNTLSKEAEAAVL